MQIIGFVLGALFLGACTSAPTVQNQPALSQAVKTQRLALVLAEIAEGKKISGCPLTADKAKEMLLPMHAKWDLEVAAQAKHVNPAISQAWVNCRSDCACAFYSNVLEKAGPKQRDRQSFGQIQAAAAATSAPERANCAERFKDLCRDPLFSELLSEVEAPAAANF